MRERAPSPAIRNLFLFIALFGSFGGALYFALAGKWSLTTLLFVLGWIFGGAIWIGQER
jgi:hypothetical protein